VALAQKANENQGQSLWKKTVGEQLNMEDALDCSRRRKLIKDPQRWGVSE